MDMIAGRSPISAATALTGNSHHPVAIVTNEVVIRGMTRAGKLFRPSDWAERLCGVVAQCGADRRMQYSPYVWQVLSEGMTCVVVDGRLEALEPMAYRFLMNFARDNELDVRMGRSHARDPSAQATEAMLLSAI